MMRPIWKGGISFGLIYLPVKLYSATKPIQIDLDYLSNKDYSPIRYARMSEKTGKEVAWKDIIRGYKVDDGDYVVLTEEDLERASVEKSKSIEIECFVKEDEIDPKFYEKPYYIESSKEASKIYYLLVEALKKSKRVGVAEFTLRSRENLVIVRPEENLLILNRLRYKSEIKPKTELDLPKKAKVSKKEVDTAVELIDKMSEHFNPDEFEDDYIIQLKKIIKKKAQNREDKIKPAGREKVPKPTEVENLMEQLEKSLKNVEISQAGQ